MASHYLDGFRSPPGPRSAMAARPAIRPRCEAVSRGTSNSKMSPNLQLFYRLRQREGNTFARRGHPPGSTKRCRHDRPNACANGHSYGIAGDHDLDDLDAFAIGRAAVLAVRARRCKIQRAAKLVERHPAWPQAPSASPARRQVARMAVAALCRRGSPPAWRLQPYRRHPEVRPDVANLGVAFGDR